MKRQAPGSRWRVLAHQDGEAISMKNCGVFDELVVDGWIHIEQMSKNQWWMRVGNGDDADIHFDIEIDRRGRVTFYCRNANKLLLDGGKLGEGLAG